MSEPFLFSFTFFLTVNRQTFLLLKQTEFELWWLDVWLVNRDIVSPSYYFVYMPYMYVQNDTSQYCQFDLAIAWRAVELCSTHLYWICRVCIMSPGLSGACSHHPLCAFIMIRCLCAVILFVTLFYFCDFFRSVVLHESHFQSHCNYCYCPDQYYLTVSQQSYDSYLIYALLFRWCITFTRINCFSY